MATDLEKFAKNSRCSKSGVVKEALRAFLWEERFRTLRATLRRTAKSKGLLTDEDVFQVLS
jgi:hypothetical protein